MRRALATLPAVVLLVAACSGSGGGPLDQLGGGGAPQGGGTAGGAVAGTSAQRAAYGYGAQTSGVDYQPGVVVVGGGPGGVRSVSDDGLRWTIDRSAPGAQRLKVGSVMLMTGNAAGRVVALSDEGSSRVVTLGPVALTDILRNGTIDLDQALDSKQLVFQAVPGLDAGATEPASGDLPSRFRAGANTYGVAGSLPPPTSTTGTFGIGPWKIKPTVSSNGKLGLSIERTDPNGLKLTGELAFLTSGLRIHGGLGVSGGKATSSSLRIDGITGFEISFGAGSANGGADNGKATLILPGEFKIAIPPSPATAGLPLTATVKLKLSLATAITGKNSTLIASGKYKLSGPIGFENGSVLTPSLSVTKSIIDSISGITLGPSGVVLALNVKTQVGVGPPILNAGPNTSVTIAFGVTNGSSLGAPLARCHGASVDIDIALGASVNLDSSIVSILSKVLPKGTKLEFGLETKKKVFSRSQVVPDVPLCR